jgi:hypothetical protein
MDKGNYDERAKIAMAQKKDQAGAAKAGKLPKPPTGWEYQVDPATGKAALDKDGQPILKQITGYKGGAGGMSGGWAQAQYQRAITAGNEAVQSVHNIMQLPATTDVGFLGNQPTGGILSTTKQMLTRQLSSQDVQSYSVMAAGIQRFAATVEASGVATGIQHFADQIGPSIVLQKGDTVQTKLLKMAELRQIITAGLSPLLDNPNISDPQKAGVQRIISGMEQAVPYTVNDVTNLSLGRAQTLAQAAKASGLAPGAPKQIRTDADYDALPPGSLFIDPNGQTRQKPQ